MAGNQVVLSFAGETKDLENSFGRVGSSSKEMSRKVGDSGEGFSRVGEAADGAEGKAQGFSDTLTGVADVGGGTAMIMKGNLFEGFVMVGQGAADLAGGLASFLIPALGKAKVAIMGMNLSLFTSPITWIIAGIVLLVAAIVLIATKTDWFQRAWRASWGWIKNAASNTWDFIKKIPGWIESAFKKVAGFISAPYRAAFNLIADAWNNTIGRLHFTIPGWIPGIGGNSISVPHLPHFHSGGIVGGTPGSETLAVLQAGERVTPASSGGAGQVIEIRSGGSRMDDLLVEILARAIGRRGGNVQVVLGNG